MIVPPLLDQLMTGFRRREQESVERREEALPIGLIQACKDQERMVRKRIIVLLFHEQLLTLMFWNAGLVPMHGIMRCFGAALARTLANGYPQVPQRNVEAPERSRRSSRDKQQIAPGKERDKRRQQTDSAGPGEHARPWRVRQDIDPDDTSDGHRIASHDERCECDADQRQHEGEELKSE
jgi:hypothetical protein